MTFSVRPILARLTRGLRKGHRRSTARRFPSFVELETLEIRACQTDPMQMNGPPPMNVPIPMSVQTALSTRLAQAESKRLAADTLETQTFYNAVTEWNTTLDSGKQAAGNLSAATNSPLQQLLSNNALSPSLTTDFANSVDNTAPGASSFNGNVDWIKMRYLCGMSLLGSAGPYAPGAGVWRTTGDTPANTKYLYDVAALPTMTASGLDWSTLSFSVSANGNDESLSTSKYTVDFASSAIKSSSSYYNGAVADPGWRTAFNVAQLNPITNVGQFWQLSVFDSIQNGPTEVSANATWFDGEKYFSFSKVKGPENKLDVIAGFDNDTTQVSGGLHIDNLGSNNQERSEWLRMRQGNEVGNSKVQLGVSVWKNPNSSFASSDIEIANAGFVLRAGAATDGTRTGFFAAVIDEWAPGHFTEASLSKRFGGGLANSDSVDRANADPDDPALRFGKMPDDVYGPTFTPDSPLQLNLSQYLLYRPTQTYRFGFGTSTSVGLGNGDRERFLQVQGSGFWAW